MPGHKSNKFSVKVVIIQKNCVVSIRNLEQKAYKTSLGEI